MVLQQLLQAPPLSADSKLCVQRESELPALGKVKSGSRVIPGQWQTCSFLWTWGLRRAKLTCSSAPLNPNRSTRIVPCSSYDTVPSLTVVSNCVQLRILSLNAVLHGSINNTLFNNHSRNKSVLSAVLRTGSTTVAQTCSLPSSSLV